MIAQLKQIIQSSNPDYIVEFEESKMMNVKADEYPTGAKFAYIEEYVSGSYTKEKYLHKKVLQIQVYFCMFTELHVDAIEREAIREEIESDIVIPFMDKYNASGVFDKVDTFKFATPLPRFDANEVSIMLQFDCKKVKC